MARASGASGSWEVRGDLTCALCARTAARVQGPRAPRFVPGKIWIRHAEHADAVRRLRCPHCGGHLSLQDPQDIYVAQPLASEHDDQPRRRRPRVSW